ncbi:MAG: uL15 family ribosomal protein [Euryarchaeota archaeon]|nr:uL15 family ribosomal protein [Euryarchaeota archaeon]
MKKRIKRIRGTRTCGGGSAKKRRGKGSRGGVGHAGAYGHHFVWSLERGIRKGNNKSQLPSYNRSDDTTVNVGDLEEMLEELIGEGKAEEKGDGIYLDANELGIQKILGKGKVTKKLMLKANKISKTAREKIERVGGSVKLEVEVESGV